MNKCIFPIGFIILLFTFINMDHACATSILKVSFEDVVLNSELVFEGKVISKEPRLSPTTGNPFTYFTFEIIDVIEGTCQDSTIELGFMGGPKGGYVMAISDMHMPELDEKGIYFVESLSREQVHPLYGWHQGHYLVLPDSPGSKEKVVPVLDDTQIINTLVIDEFKQLIRDIRSKTNDDD